MKAGEDTRRGRRRLRARLGVIVLSAAVALPALLAASCGSTAAPGSGLGGTQAISPTSTGTAAADGSGPEPTPATTTTYTAISEADVESVRAVVSAFWAAYNAYDPETAVSFLHATYRASKEPIIRSEIRRIKTFGVQLGVTEKSTPILLGPDEAEMYLNLKEPLGTRTILTRLLRHGDTWVIVYSEEAK